MFPQLPRGSTELTGGARRLLTWRIAGSVGCGGLSLRDGCECAHQLLAQQSRP